MFKYRNTFNLGKNIVVVTTIDFPPLGTDPNFEYTGFESEVTVNGKFAYGSGPETNGETPLDCHRAVVAEAPQALQMMDNHFVL